MLSRRTISRYIARRFMVGMAITFLFCSGIIFMLDFLELLRESGKWGGVASIHQLIAIALLRLPAYTEVLLGFAVLVGSIATLVALTRRSELAVMRAGGMSVWQFLRPGIAVAFWLGVFSVAVYNPFAAHGRTIAENMFAKVFGKESNILKTQAGGSWLRQDGADGQSVITAAAASGRGMTLTGVTAFVFDEKGAFVERLDAASAQLEEGFWRIENGWAVRAGREPQKFGTYLLSTYLTPDRAASALGTLLSVSVWELPTLIDVAEKAKLSTDRLRVQFEQLLVRPLLLATMVLLAATVSLRSFRSGRIQTMVVTGMVGGVGFFLLAEVSRQIGAAGLAPAWAAVWLPVILAMLLSTTVLMHQEDG